MTNLPILPLDPRTEVSFQSQFTPNIYQQNGGYTDRLSKVKRKVPKGSMSLTTYVRDLKTVTNFLHERSGYKPFQVLQDGKYYFCKAWTVTFVSTPNAGTIQMEMIRYTNPT